MSDEKLNNWQRIDTAPEDELVAITVAGSSWIGAGRKKTYVDADNHKEIVFNVIHYNGDVLVNQFYPTHWMPLSSLIPTEPAIPAEGERAQFDKDFADWQQQLADETEQTRQSEIMTAKDMTLRINCTSESRASSNDQGSEIHRSVHRSDEERVQEITARLDRLQLQQGELLELASTDVERAYENTINDLIVDSRYLLTRLGQVEAEREFERRLKRRYYNEAVEGWGRFRQSEQQVAQLTEEVKRLRDEALKE